MAPDQQTDGEVSGTTVHRLEFDVEWPPGHAAAYLLDGAEPTLVDAGMPGESNEERLSAQLGALGYDAADVAHVVVTHPHLDHVGLAPELLAAGEPTVYAPATYRKSLDRSLGDVEESVREQARRAGIAAELADGVVDRAVTRHREIRAALPGDAVDVWVAGGDRVAVGDRTFEAVYAPGHQRDHLCYETDLDGVRVSFSGDMAIRPFRAAAVHANFDAAQTEAVTAYYGALDRLRGRDVERVFPGHGPVHEEFDAAITNARDGLDRLCSRTLEAVRPDGTHAVHAAMARTEELADGPYVPEAVGALAHLERTGRLSSSVEGGVRYFVPA